MGLIGGVYSQRVTPLVSGETIGIPQISIPLIFPSGDLSTLCPLTNAAVMYGVVLCP